MELHSALFIVYSIRCYRAIHDEKNAYLFIYIIYKERDKEITI